MKCQSCREQYTTPWLSVCRPHRKIWLLRGLLHLLLVVEKHGLRIGELQLLLLLLLLLLSCCHALIQQLCVWHPQCQSLAGACNQHLPWGPLRQDSRAELCVSG